MAKDKAIRTSDKEKFFINFLRENELSVQRTLHDLLNYYFLKSNEEENSGNKKMFQSLYEKVNMALEEISNIDLEKNATKKSK